MERRGVKGEVKLLSNITFGIEFTPIIDGLLCNILNKAVIASDLVNQHIVELELATITAGLASEIGAAVYGAGAAVGVISTAPAYADFENKPIEREYRNSEKTLLVTFTGQELVGGNE